MNSDDLHTLVHAVRGNNNDLIGFIAIHRGNKDHPAFGATRIESYPSIHEALYDVLDLAWLMSHKAALADIPYGGGKGVLFDRPELKDSNKRKEILALYARAVNTLGGRFVTGSDVGVSQEDVNFMRTHSSHIVGITEDPTKRTAEGLLGSITVTLLRLFGEPSLGARSFAIQGVGKVGMALLDLIGDKTTRVTIADTDGARTALAKEKHPHVRVVSPENILSEDVDILIPCALGGIFNEVSVPTVKAKAIVGSANNQLASTEAGDMLYERRILYAPDYVVNAGGLISVVHEFEKEKKADTQKNLDDAIAAIPIRLAEILNESKETGVPTHRIADTIARMKIESLYPGHDFS